MFLASKLGVPTLDIIWSSTTCLKKNRYKTKRFEFWQKKTLRKSTITFNYQIIDERNEFPYCMLLFDKYYEQPIKLETAVMWSKSNLNMNIYEDSTFNFWICAQTIISKTVMAYSKIYIWLQQNQMGIFAMAWNRHNKFGSLSSRYSFMR